MCNFVNNFCSQNYDLCDCLNHDFDKINKISRIFFNTENAQSCTEKIILNHSIQINHSSDRIMTFPQPSPKLRLRSVSKGREQTSPQPPPKEGEQAPLNPPSGGKYSPFEGGKGDVHRWRGFANRAVQTAAPIANRREQRKCSPPLEGLGEVLIVN